MEKEFHSYRDIKQKISNLMSLLVKRQHLMAALDQADPSKNESIDHLHLELRQGTCSYTDQLPLNGYDIRDLLAKEVERIDRFCEEIIHANEDSNLRVGSLLLRDKAQTEVLKKALDTYGIEKQTLMLFEEMAELQNALCKLSRGRAFANDVITEIADVIIMCRQIALHFGVEAVEAEIQAKIKRLNLRLNSGEI